MEKHILAAAVVVMILISAKTRLGFLLLVSRKQYSQLPLKKYTEDVLVLQPTPVLSKVVYLIMLGRVTRVRVRVKAQLAEAKVCRLRT